MGTRGARGFVVNGVEKVTYVHYDAYADGLGTDFINWLKSKSIDELKEIASNIELVDQDTSATDDMIEYVMNFEKVNNIRIMNLNVSNRNPVDKYCLFGELQDNFKAYGLGFKYMIDSKDFLYDGLFCEHAYIMNLDTGKFEYYKGFSHECKNQGRYNITESEYITDSGSKYYGVSLMNEFEFNDIGKFITEICEKDE